MGYAEKRRGYYLARYRVGEKMMTVKDEHGATIRYATKPAAKAAAVSEQAKVQLGTWRDPTGGQTSFGDWVNIWYERQDLAPSTMQNYKHHIEEHLSPTFEEMALAQIFGADVDECERKEGAAGYSVFSVRTWRTTLSTVWPTPLSRD
ncbi:N-terminal phage integrase SAM-like domain-containing protein [Jiangella asiatica]|uniref:N-terminal phage integrase SAM-like domain-containing protein n=1 Tax=Jiangella asiatica TaxID=2530372 RepID=UPI00193D0313|nr:N-terminal phage integrase SAM-like domain-containing protein [Jiangella asiatica]